MKSGPKKINENYAIYDEKLGEGAFGVISKGFSKKDNCIVAIKKLKPEGAQQWFTDPKFKLETEVLLKVQHPNVVRVFQALEMGRDVYIVMQFCTSGDLKQLMARRKRENAESGIAELPNKGPLSDIMVFDIFCQICAGMAEVNRQKYMHRDLKLENVMLTDNNIVKIADFGLARGIIGNDLFKMERFSAKGTPLYAAPNILLKEPYSPKCDVYSLGLMIYEMLTGVHLFHDAKNMSDLRNLQKTRLCDNKLVLPANMPQFFKEILPMMITYYEADRTDFIKIEKDVLSVRLKIGRSIDSEYNFKDLSTGKQEGEATVERPMTQNTAYQPATGPTGGFGGTQTIMLEKLTEQQFMDRKAELFNFAYYAYKRGRLMVDLMQRINHASYPLQNVLKYTLAFLEMGIFMNSNRQMIQKLSTQVIRLPSGTELNVLTLTPERQANLKQEIQNFTTQIENEENNFKNLLQTLYTKLTSADYKAKFPSVYATYPDVYKALDYLVQHNSLQNAEFFSYYFEQFLKQECAMRDYRQQPEQAVRTFNMALTLCQLRSYLPDSQYINGDSVEFAKQTFNEMPLESIYHRIKAIIGC